MMPMTFRRGGNGAVEIALGSGFDVTRGDRTRRTRTYSVGGADQHADPTTLDRLRETSRDMDRNSCLMHGILDRFVHNVIGDRFTFRPMTDDEAWNRAALDYMVAQAGPQSDVRGMFDWHDRLALTLRALGTDGDNFHLHVKGGMTQIVEGHQVGTPGDLRRQANVVNGIEMTKAGRPTAIWVGNNIYRDIYPSSTSGKMRRIPAGQFLWPAYRTRYTQTRGIPMIAAALSHYDRLDEYIDNESLAAAIDACLAFFVQGDIDPDFLPDDVYTRDSTDGEGNSTTEALQQISPGMIARIGRDEKVEAFGAKRPGDQFDPYITMSLRILGASMGMPLELVLLDFSKTNYSSARAALLQAYRMFRCWQQWLIRNVCNPQYRRWVGQAIASGDLTANDQAGKVRWFPPQWGWVDPWKEIKALETAIGLGVKSQTQEIERNGQTLDEYVTERKTEIDRMAAAGIPSSAMQHATAPNGPNAYDAAQGQTDPVDRKPTNRETDQ